MMKRPVLLAVVMILSLLMGACQKAKENDAKKGRAENKEVKQQPVSEGQPGMLEQGQSLQPEAITTTGAGQPETINSSSKETVPLVTEVMTKEELQAYLKEKNIPIITKENFKEPELVWEKTYEGEHIQEISDVTEKENLIIFSGKQPTAKEPHPDIRLLFIDSKGDVRKKVNIGKLSYREKEGDVKRDHYAVAASGKAAVIANWKKGTKVVTVAYYDEEGNQIWTKDIKVNPADWGALAGLKISNNGESIAILEANPEYDGEGGAVNESMRLIILDDKGNQMYEQKGYIIKEGEFSGDGNYYAGVFWDGTSENGLVKLTYINVKEGKIVWERPWISQGDYFSEKNHLVISVNGSYVAGVDVFGAKKITDYSKQDPFDFYEIDVFDKEGKLVSRIKDAEVYRIAENGLMITRGRNHSQLSDVLKSKFIIRLEYGSIYNFDLRPQGEVFLYEVALAKNLHGALTLNGKYYTSGYGPKASIYKVPGGQDE